MGRRRNPRKAGAVAAALLSLGAAQATEPFPGWRAVVADDVSGTVAADQERRRALPELGLRATGDFDRDGRADVARLMVSPERSEYAAFVALNTRAGVVTLKLPSGALHTLGRAAVETERAGGRDRLVVRTFEGARVRFDVSALRVRSELVLD